MSTTHSWLSRNMKALFASLVLVAAMLTLFFAQDDAASGSTYTSNESVTYLDFAGTIRNTGSGWYVLNDAGHEPDDLTIGAVTSVSVQVFYPECSQMVSFIAVPDETYASTFGATFGASAGLTYAYIKGSINDGSDSGTAADPWDPTTDYSANSNIWISGRCIPA